MRRLRTKLTMLLLLVASVGVIGTAFFLLRLHAEDKKLYVTEMNSLVAPQVAASLGKSFEALTKELQRRGGVQADDAVPLPESLFKESLDLAGGLPAGVFDAKGQMLARTGPSVPARIWNIPTIELATAKVVAREIELLPGRKVFASFAPIPHVPGAFVAVISPTVTATQLLTSALRASSGFLVGVFLLALLLGLLFSAQIARPLEELTDATSRVASGQWQILLRSRPRDEIGRLVKAFSKMVRDLESRERDLKETQVRLVRSESLAALGRFGAGIAHEVKNPLSSILGYAQLLQRDPKADAAKGSEYLGLIMEETRRASRIISDLLMFARQKPPVLALHDLVVLIGEAREKMLPQAQELGIELRLELPSGEEFKARVDPEQLYQVLLNLGQNAFHALEGKSAGTKDVTFRLRRSRDRIVLEVSDNGPGIPPEHLPKLFEPFFSTKEVGKGSGLGLSLCHGIVIQHGGTITAESEPGNGALFRIDLPAYG